MTGAEFKAARKWLEKTQDEMAVALGFNSGRYIRDLESGRQSVTARTAKDVQRLLNDFQPCGVSNGS